MTREPRWILKLQSPVSWSIENSFSPRKVVEGSLPWNFPNIRWKIVSKFSTFYFADWEYPVWWRCFTHPRLRPKIRFHPLNGRNRLDLKNQNRNESCFFFFGLLISTISLWIFDQILVSAPKIEISFMAKGKQTYSIWKIKITQ